MNKIMIFIIIILISGQAWGANYSGEYVSKDGNVNLTISKTQTGDYAIELLGIVGSHIGEVSFDANANEVEKLNKVSYSKSDEGIKYSGCWMELQFLKGTVIIKQEFEKEGFSGPCDAGEGVVFYGTYRKKTANNTVREVEPSEAAYKKTFKKLFIGKRDVDPWVKYYLKTGAGVTGSHEEIQIGGKSYKLESICQPHLCSGNYIHVLYDRGATHACAIFTKDDGTYRFFGNPDDKKQAALLKIAAEHN